MTNKTYPLKVQMKHSIAKYVSKEASERLQAARKAVGVIEDEIIKAFKATPEFRALINTYGSILKVDHHCIIGTYEVHTDKLMQIVSRKSFLGETTINQLLTSKFLTDKEKRAMLDNTFGKEIFEDKETKKPLSEYEEEQYMNR